MKITNSIVRWLFSEAVVVLVAGNSYVTAGVWGVDHCINATRRYGPLRGPNFSFFGGLWPRPRLFLPFGPKKRAFYAVWVHFRPILCTVLTSIRFISTNSNLTRNPPKKTQIIPMSLKISMYPINPKIAEQIRNLNILFH